MRHIDTDTVLDPPQRNSLSPQRMPALDLFRGGAVLLMLVYHFFFDLNYFGVVSIRFQTDPFWLSLRAVIVGGFVLAVGVSLALSTQNGLNFWRFFRRQTVLGVAAGLVSLGTFLIFPLTWVVFGVLHFIFVARILALPFLRLHAFNVAFGVLFILVGLSVQHPVFNHPWLHWLGMMTHKPFTEDYVPVLPWFGVLLLGVFIGQSMHQGRRLFLSEPLWLPGFRLLSWMGRHSLLIYLLHQPLFMGVLYLMLR
ncbi:heparan-alpha-glucosaminide N-acetyltransferase [Desulfonatronum thioautotrophicum]|uniref:heparan-alpha-glucosaminide N-acetyltransferase n=1 Tax=Desulfonatronum thioautotrophicum TaxID=617001 RepID=UPI000A0543DD|nr:heparan-alpha-glucosaminide N-acetyltransferase [Desulfonatronum thioautotrophicum]